MAEIALATTMETVSISTGTDSGESLELYDHGTMVSEIINMDFIKKFYDVDYALMWLRQVAESKECTKCKGSHNVLICPHDNCMNCGEPGHWDLICRNGASEKLSKEDFDREVASYKLQKEAENAVDDGVDLDGYASDCGSCESFDSYG